MKLEHLTKTEIQVLDHIVGEGQISRKTLPMGIGLGLDSMGPIRNSKTDALYPGTKEVLGRFSEVMAEYDIMLAVATNGPDIEGRDILESLVGSVPALAVTEGGGKLISRHPQAGQLEYTLLADEEEREHLAELEKLVSERPLMAALLGDKRPFDGGGSSIRTPYDTNTVLTLPSDFDVLNARLSAVGVNLQAELQEVNQAEFVKQILGYAHGQYTEAIQKLGLDQKIAVLTKLQNRRTYVMPMHNHAGGKLNKYSGVVLGSQHMSVTPGYHDREYWMGNSIYVADKAVDISGEGQPVIGASERSMVVGGVTYFGEKTPNTENINVVSVQSVSHAGHTIYLGEVSSRMAINVTMDDALPKMDRVEGVPILHIGSGLKALEGIAYLYQRVR